MRAAIALRLVLVTVARQVGLEGAFLLAGTACLATAASFFSAAGPWFVTGAIALLIGLVLAQPRRP